jgi:diguanylate cyclase (GGDEF)-like protein
MTHSKFPVLPTVAYSALGISPAILAAYFAPGGWAGLAAVGAALTTTVLLVGNIRRTRELGLAELRLRQLQSTASASEAQIAALMAKVRDASTQDEVTGTLNRRAFLARLDEVLQRDARLQKPLAVLLLDVDDFKKINAEAGRIIGDRVLLAVGRAIQASTRGTDFIGRIGGDEFVVVLGECLDPNPAIDRIFVALHGETTGGERPLPIRVSIGLVTIPEPQKRVDAFQLFRLAEEALNSVRGAGGSRCGKREYRTESPSPVGASRT